MPSKVAHSSLSVMKVQVVKVLAVRSSPSMNSAQLVVEFGQTCSPKGLSAMSEPDEVQGVVKADKAHVCIYTGE